MKLKDLIIGKKYNFEYKNEEKTEVYYLGTKKHNIPVIQPIDKDRGISGLSTLTEITPVLSHDYYLGFCGIEEHLSEIEENTVLTIDNIEEVKLNTKEPTMKKEFVLPEKWCIKITKENKPMVQKYNVCREIGYNYTIGGYYGNELKGSWITEDSTEITFEQFKKYVLKESYSKPKKLWDVYTYAVCLEDGSNCSTTKKGDIYQILQNNLALRLKDYYELSFTVSLQKEINEFKPSITLEEAEKISKSLTEEESKITMFKKDDYIVFTEGEVPDDKKFPINYLFKQREDDTYLKPYLDTIGDSTNGWVSYRNVDNNYCPTYSKEIIKSKWRYGTTEEIAEYDRLGKPFDITNMKNKAEEYPKHLSFYVRYCPEFTEDLYNALFKWSKENNKCQERRFNESYEGLKIHEYFLYDNWGLRCKVKPDYNAYGYGVDNNSQFCEKELSIKEVKILIGYTDNKVKENFKFEVGKWYKRDGFDYVIKFLGTTTDNAILYSDIIDMHKTHEFTPNGDTGVGYASDKGWYMLTDLSEIQPYLPEGHSDKIIQKEDKMKYKFKVGDRVKCICHGHGCTFGEIGTRTTIVELGKYNSGLGYKVDYPKIGNSLTGTCGGFIGEQSFELVEIKSMEEKSDMKYKTNWKIGDEFQVIANNPLGSVLQVGKTYKVYRVNNSSVDTQDKNGERLLRGNVSFEYMIDESDSRWIYDKPVTVATIEYIKTDWKEGDECIYEEELFTIDGINGAEVLLEGKNIWVDIDEIQVVPLCYKPISPETIKSHSCSIEYDYKSNDVLNFKNKGAFYDKMEVKINKKSKNKLVKIKLN